MIQYYKTLITQTKNPEHKKYYQQRLCELGVGKIKDIKTNQASEFNFKFGVNRVYSEKLNKYFNSMSSASKYVKKGRSYTRRCLIGELENKYLFKVV